MMTLVRNQPLAEEITQNTFYRAMTSKKAFAQRSGELTWLCSIAKHLAAKNWCSAIWNTAQPAGRSMRIWKTVPWTAS